MTSEKWLNNIGDRWKDIKDYAHLDHKDLTGLQIYNAFWQILIAQPLYIFSNLIAYTTLRALEAIIVNPKKTAMIVAALGLLIPSIILTFTGVGTPLGILGITAFTSHAIFSGTLLTAAANLGIIAALSAAGASVTVLVGAGIEKLIACVKPRPYNLKTRARSITPSTKQQNSRFSADEERDLTKAETTIDGDTPPSSNQDPAAQPASVNPEIKSNEDTRTLSESQQPIDSTVEPRLEKTSALSDQTATEIIPTSKSQVVDPSKTPNVDVCLPTPGSEVISENVTTPRSNNESFYNNLLRGIEVLSSNTMTGKTSSGVELPINKTSNNTPIYNQSVEQNNKGQQDMPVFVEHRVRKTLTYKYKLRDSDGETSDREITTTSEVVRAGEITRKALAKRNEERELARKQPHEINRFGIFYAEKYEESKQELAQRDSPDTYNTQTNKAAMLRPSAIINRENGPFLITSKESSSKKQNSYGST